MVYHLDLIANVSTHLQTSVMKSNASNVGEMEDFLMNVEFQWIDEMKRSIALVNWTYIPCFVIVMLGLLGNLLTICKIVLDKSLHTPTYTAIGFLAFSDIMSLIFSALSWFTNIRTYLIATHYHDQTFLNTQDMFYILELMVYHVSLCQIILLVVLRFGLTVNPIECKIHASTSLILIASAAIWIYNACVWFTFRVVFKTLVRQNRNQFLKWATIVEVSVRCLAMLVTLSIMAILHYLKMRAIKTSSVKCNVKRRMNQIVAIIVVILAFYGISYLLATIVMFVSDRTVTAYFSTFHQIIGFVHFSSNPFVYFIFAFVCKKKS